MRRLRPTTRATVARHIAEALVEGFDRHYRLFRGTSAAAKDRFDAGDWAGIQDSVRERIRFYDDRVEESVARLRDEFAAETIDRETWAGSQARLHRPARRPQAPGARRDLLQLRRAARAPQHLLQERVHLRPLGGLDGVHRVEPADLPQLLPAGGGTAHDPRLRLPRLRLDASVRRPRPRRRPRDEGPARAPRRAAGPRRSRTSRSRC